MSLIKRPDCRVILFNYQEREGSNLKKIGLPPIINSKIDISSAVMAVNTSKTKSSSSGNFVMTLAPTDNWVSQVSPGSWIVVLLSDGKISDQETLFFQESSLKLIGRIDSVRASRQVDQATGSYSTTYSIVGRDWCSCLESSIYIDQIAAELPSVLAGTPVDSAFGQATRFKFDSKIAEIYKKGVPNTSDWADAIFDIWGKQGSLLNIASGKGKDLAERFLPTAPLNIPAQLGLSLGKTSIFLPDLIKRQYGVLNPSGTLSKSSFGQGFNSTTTYKRNTEAIGFVDIRKLLGVNTLWQLLQSSVSAGGINEIFGDLSFENSTPLMTVYKRVRPFALSGIEIFGLNFGNASKLAAIEGVGIAAQKEITSSFFDLPKRKIESEEIIQIDVGTNWSDVVNFIEIMPEMSMFPYAKSIAPQIKAGNAEYSIGSYAISGFKPIIINSTFFPSKSGTPDPYGLKDWLPMLKEWYFDTHKMLNGSLTISGRKGYIAVGENILFPASAISDADFVSGGVIPGVVGASEQWVLAHVESVSHSFSKGQGDHSSSFTTSVSFVRGIITDSNGRGKIASNASGYGIDSKSPSAPRKNRNIRGPT